MSNGSLYVITGASRGLGRALAAHLDAAGASLLLAARGMIRDTYADALTIAADLSTAEGVERVLDALVGLLAEKRPHAVTLVNNAGTVEPVAPAHRCHPDDVEAAIRLNLLAPMRLTSGLISAVAGLDCEATVVNVSSGAASGAYAGWSSYCASKAGLDHFTRCVGLEQAGRARPVTVIALAPGVVDTAMQGVIRATDPGDFPMIGKFLRLKEDGALLSPETCAARIVAFLERRVAGTGGVYDLRDVAVD